jgi:hypothetical protein
MILGVSLKRLGECAFVKAQEILRPLMLLLVVGRLRFSQMKATSVLVLGE